jgi:hypothetical protein
MADSSQSRDSVAAGRKSSAPPPTNTAKTKNTNLLRNTKSLPDPKIQPKHVSHTSISAEKLGDSAQDSDFDVDLDARSSENETTKDRTQTFAESNFYTINFQKPRPDTPRTETSNLLSHPLPSVSPSLPTASTSVSHSGTKRHRSSEEAPVSESAAKKVTVNPVQPHESSGETIEITIREANETKGGKEATHLFVDMLNSPKTSYIEFITLLQNHPHHLLIADIDKSYDQSGFILKFTDKMSADLFLSKAFNNALDHVNIRMTRHKTARNAPPKGRCEVLIFDVRTSTSTNDIKEYLEANLNIVVHGCFRLTKPDRRSPNNPSNRFAIPVVKVIIDRKDAHLFQKHVTLFTYKKCLTSDPIPIVTPIQCNKCHSFRHNTQACPTVPHCRLCASAACPNPQDCPNPRRCINCGEAHSARYTKCPAFKAASDYLRRVQTEKRRARAGGNEGNGPITNTNTNTKQINVIPDDRPPAPTFLDRGTYNSKYDTWSVSMSAMSASQLSEPSRVEPDDQQQGSNHRHSSPANSSANNTKHQKPRQKVRPPPLSQLRSDSETTQTDFPKPRREHSRGRRQRRRNESEVNTNMNTNTNTNTNARPTSSSQTRQPTFRHAPEETGEFIRGIDGLFQRLESMHPADLPFIVITICHKLLGLLIHQHNLLNDVMHEQTQR